MARFKKKAQTWHLKGALGLAAVFVGCLVVYGALGGVSPLGLTSTGSTGTGASAVSSGHTGTVLLLNKTAAASAHGTATSYRTSASHAQFIVTFAQGTSSSDQASEIAAAGANRRQRDRAALDAHDQRARRLQAGRHLCAPGEPERRQRRAQRQPQDGRDPERPGLRGPVEPADGRLGSGLRLGQPARLVDDRRARHRRLRVDRRPEPRRRLVGLRDRPDERPERPRHRGRLDRGRDHRQRTASRASTSAP